MGKVFAFDSACGFDKVLKDKGYASLHLAVGPDTVLASKTSERSCSVSASRWIRPFRASASSRRHDMTTGVD